MHRFIAIIGMVPICMRWGRLDVAVGRQDADVRSQHQH